MHAVKSANYNFKAVLPVVLLEYFLDQSDIPTSKAKILFKE